MYCSRLVSSSLKCWLNGLLLKHASQKFGIFFNNSSLCLYSGSFSLKYFTFKVLNSFSNFLSISSNFPKMPSTLFCSTSFNIWDMLQQTGGVQGIKKKITH
eukprot:NODE_425_length_8856_cov_0.734841.p6 type:complete len:101 gc:universal NODE_425_length_8856_cov_0.734841:640-942(+)